MDGFLCIRGLTKRFDLHVVLDGVDLDVGRGELFAILGPSGAGKSSLLNTVVGVEGFEEGRITLAGCDLGPIAANKRSVGVVFQSYALFPHMTVRENVAFPLLARRAHGVSGFLRTILRGRLHAVGVRRVERALSIVRLQGHADKLPSQLSGGEQQRVALARALVFDPTVLCLDEPLGALDRSLRQYLQSEIRSIQQRLGKTTLYVTHDQTEAMTVADKIAILNEGRVEQVGTPDDLYLRPANQFVASFLGECNLFEAGSVDMCAGGYAVTTPGGTKVFCADAPVPGTHILGIRPENLEIRCQPGGVGPTLTGRVTNLAHIGPTQRVELALAGGERCIVTSLRDDQSSVPPPGHEICIFYDPANMRCLSIR